VAELAETASVHPLLEIVISFHAGEVIDRHSLTGGRDARGQKNRKAERGISKDIHQITSFTTKTAPSKSLFSHGKTQRVAEGVGVN
jgi:hypothetical protein